jgi:hypothetical protein
VNADGQLNRKINQVFIQVAKRIYRNDMEREDRKNWWPIKPPLLDYPIVAFYFSELIRLFKKADEKDVSNQEIAKLLGTKEDIFKIQFLWPSLGFSPTDISYEDKLFLISKLVSVYEAALTTGKEYELLDKIGEEVRASGDESVENVLRTGTRIYFSFLKALYEYLEEDWEKAVKEATKQVLSKKDSVQDPDPWGNTSEGAAIRKLVRNSDFRREKEKNLKQILQGVPEVPGIAQGVVGENIMVDFTIAQNAPDADAFITDIDAFKNKPIKEKLIKEGVVVISRTRNGTRNIEKDQKVFVDGTSGIVYKNP